MTSITGVDILSEGVGEYVIVNPVSSSKLPLGLPGQPGKFNLDMTPGTWTIKNGNLTAATVSINADGTISVAPGNGGLQGSLSVVTTIGPF
ncbi:hypothetical protein E4U53_001811 [Claviceps sorghi]|nr:hypothetical protein E4U53_001811 [Claviceps sorghi]